MNPWWVLQHVCVTGGRGALGKRLVRRLAACGVSRIVTLDTQPTLSGGGTIDSACVEHLTGSILDPTELDRALTDCTVVFHLGALIHVGHSRTDPIRYFEVNGLGTAHLLESCRRLGISRVIYTSTSHVYGTPLHLPVTEDHPTRPISVYAASKLTGEVALQAYAANYNISCDIVRLANLYGASFGNDTVVGCALQQVASGGCIALRDLVPVRDFVHADDVVEALVRLAASGEGRPRCRVVNVSTGQGMSIREMAQALGKVAAEQGLGWPDITQIGNSGNDPVPSLVLDNSRLRKLTHWSPQMSLEQGLRLALQELQTQKQYSEK